MHCSYDDNLAAFRKLADGCEAVICCRMSPLQKSKIVRMIKEGPTGPVTAAVGDGANDLYMIEEAGLGVAYHAKPITEERADAYIRYTDLSSLLYFQGYGYDEFVQE